MVVAGGGTLWGIIANISTRCLEITNQLPNHCLQRDVEVWEESQVPQLVSHSQMHDLTWMFASRPSAMPRSLAEVPVDLLV